MVKGMAYSGFNFLLVGMTPRDNQEEMMLAQKTQSLRSLFVVLFSVAALALPPTTARAVSPFNPFVAEGPFVISLGLGIKPAGESGRFVVPSRRVFGFLSGSVNAPFMIQFATNVPISTQSGNIHGTLFICENATPPPGLEFFGCVDPSTLDFSSEPAFLLSLDTATLDEAAVSQKARVHIVSSLVPGADPAHPMLNLGGVFTFVGWDTQGHGDGSGSVTLILDAEGHIIGLGDSNLAFCGVWSGPASSAACPFAQ
ncbi:MAG: hypothetical protein ACREYC_23130 [Gammaproteobacteria bacterium]